MRDVSHIRKVIIARPDLLDAFVHAAIGEYRASRPGHPPRHWALLLGRADGDIAHVHRLREARNIREDSPLARTEFAENVIPAFGACYGNPRRGFWCDSRDLLAAHREAEADGLEILGSVHLHPGPPFEPDPAISEHPTPMDRYMYTNTGWPVNLITYLSLLDDQPHVAIGAWGVEGVEVRGLSMHVAVEV